MGNPNTKSPRIMISLMKHLKENNERRKEGGREGGGKEEGEGEGELEEDEEEEEGEDEEGEEEDKSTTATRKTRTTTTQTYSNHFFLKPALIASFPLPATRFIIIHDLKREDWRTSFGLKDLATKCTHKLLLLFLGDFVQKKSMVPMLFLFQFSSQLPLVQSGNKQQTQTSQNEYRVPKQTKQ